MARLKRKVKKQNGKSIGEGKKLEREIESTNCIALAYVHYTSVSADPAYGIR